MVHFLDVQISVWFSGWLETHINPRPEWTNSNLEEEYSCVDRYVMKQTLVFI